MARLSRTAFLAVAVVFHIVSSGQHIVTVCQEGLTSRARFTSSAFLTSTLSVRS